MKIALLGSGPERIGKSGELDRFGVAGLRYLKEAGHQTLWLDDNPVSVACSGILESRVYLEPLNLAVLAEILARERPDALMHAYGGHLAQHLVVFLDREGVLDRLGISVLGTQPADLKRCLDQEILSQIETDLGVTALKPSVARTAQECIAQAEALGFPILLRPALPLEGVGGYLVFNLDEVQQIAAMVLNASPVGEALLEQPPLDWKHMAVQCLCDPRQPAKLLWQGTLEALDKTVGANLGNSNLISPSLSLQGQLLSKALAWAGSLADELMVYGILQLRLALSPQDDQLMLLGVDQGLNRLTAFLSLGQGLSLGRLSAAACLGELVPALLSHLEKEYTGPVMLRTPATLEPGSQDGSTGPTLRALGAGIRLGRDLAHCKEKAETGSEQKPAKGTAQIVCYAEDRLGFMAPAPPKDPKRPALGRKIGSPDYLLLLGPGPYKIGWGAEVDCALHHTARVLREMGQRLILINNNPDAVSLDPELMDLICLEPTTLAAVAAVLDQWPVSGLVHQFCPNLPPGLESLLAEKQVPVLGTPLRQRERLLSPRQRWRVLKKAGVPLLIHAWATDQGNAFSQADSLGYPVLTRLSDQEINPPSDIFYDAAGLAGFLTEYGQRISEQTPLYLEKFSDGMIGAQLLALCDGEDCLELEFLENIEEYGIHSGDCATINTALSIGEMPMAIAREALKMITGHFKVAGHLTLDLAVTGRHCYLTGIWPYPSSGLALAEKPGRNDIHRLAAQALLGNKVSQGIQPIPQRSRRYLVKEAVFPHRRFPGQDPVLSSRMRSTGQVLGHDDSIGKAYYKSQLAVNPELPTQGSVFISARDTEKDSILQVALKLAQLGFNLLSTQGTAIFLAERGLAVTRVYKVSEERPNIFDLIKNGEIGMVINIPGGQQSKIDDQKIRRATIEQNIPLITTISGAFLMASGLAESRRSPLTFASL